MQHRYGPIVPTAHELSLFDFFFNRRETNGGAEGDRLKSP
jgi:hypothetical protein